MMRQGELFVQILPPDVKAPEFKVNPKAPAALKPATPAVPAKPAQPR
jgi:hypothetical protein